MQRSDELNEIAKALCLAQAEIEGANRNSVNPHLKNKYADLGSVWDAAKPALTKNGLSVAQFCEPSEPGTLALVTMLLHSSGQFLSGTSVIPLSKADAQGYGSALTYARRYGLAAMVGVCPEDDDAHAATAGSRQTTPPQRQQEQPRQVRQPSAAVPSAPAVPMNREQGDKIVQKCRLLGLDIPNFEDWTEAQAKAEYSRLRGLEAAAEANEASALAAARQ